MKADEDRLLIGRESENTFTCSKLFDNRGEGGGSVFIQGNWEEDDDDDEEEEDDGFFNENS